MDFEDLENRFAYHVPKNETTKIAHDRVRNFCFDLAEELSIIVPEGREKDLAITHLEQVMMWANAGIARAK